MRETSLHVSLGHSSSACYAVDGIVVRGYEQERINLRKGSSDYPAQAVEMALSGCRADVAYVTHWFDHYVPGVNKYFNRGHLEGFAKEIVWPDRDLTHHDAHARSACAFAKGRGFSEPSLVIVMDGFGNNRECFSAYHMDWWSHDRPVPRLTHRTFGYSVSLGLMYQYATDFLGMRMHQDEYKLLGYETKVLSLVTYNEAMAIKSRIMEEAEIHADEMMKSTVPDAAGDGLINTSLLTRTKENWHRRFRKWAEMFPTSTSQTQFRATVAFCAQTFLEHVTLNLIKRVMMPSCRNIVLTGGCFYNVKLNREVQRVTGCRVFSHPLAGDCGAALGMGPVPAMVRMDVGERRLYRAGEPVPGMRFLPEDEWVDMATDLIASGKVVNVVRGGMEYGPRALCNTSTLALPTEDNVSVINHLNARSTVMPMAPVMTVEAAHRFFVHDEIRYAVESLEFMITTVGWKREPDSRLKGVCLADPMGEGWTSRPQVVSQHTDPHLTRLLHAMPDQTLINTSFNYHGEPIVFTVADATRTHIMQRNNAHHIGQEGPITLVVTS